MVLGQSSLFGLGIYALVPYLEKTRELEPDYSLSVSWNGREVLNEKVTREDLSRGAFHLSLGADRADGEDKLEIRARGKGKLYYQANAHWVVERDSLAARDRAIRITRSYARLMVYFLDHGHDGERTFSYVLRAETPGAFIALPARAESIYYPDIGGHSGSARFRVVD